jgi:GNAT superfamily N-acetyltransferase
VIEVSAAEPELATDGRFIDTVVSLVNDAYNLAEGGLWQPGHLRTDADDAARATAAGHVVVARIAGQIVGTVRTRSLDEQTGWFGALATDQALVGRGIATALVAHAHARAAQQGCVRMQIERLQPAGPHPHIEQVAAWYSRLGYTETSRRPLAEADPATARFQLQPCDLIVCHRPLP